MTYFKIIQKDYLIKNVLLYGSRKLGERSLELDREENSIIARILPQAIRKYVTSDIEKERKKIEKELNKLLLIHLNYSKQTKC